MTGYVVKIFNKISDEFEFERFYLDYEDADAKRNSIEKQIVATPYRCVRIDKYVDGVRENVFSL